LYFERGERVGQKNERKRQKDSSVEAVGEASDPERGIISKEEERNEHGLRLYRVMLLIIAMWRVA
jgi:hypothetical protein